MQTTNKRKLSFLPLLGLLGNLSHGIRAPQAPSSSAAVAARNATAAPEVRAPALTGCGPYSPRQSPVAVCVSTWRHPSPSNPWHGSFLISETGPSRLWADSVF